MVPMGTRLNSAVEVHSAKERLAERFFALLESTVAHILCNPTQQTSRPPAHPPTGVRF